jgi:hypothetical protein
MLKNPPLTCKAKLRCLTAALEDAPVHAANVSRRPVWARAHHGCRAHLLRLSDRQVQAPSSVQEFDDGPTFVGARSSRYRLAPDRDVRVPSPDGGLLEIPLSYGFNRGPFSVWDPTRRLLEAAPFRWFHLAGLAEHTGLVRRIALCPELASADDMLTLSRRLLEHGVRHLHLSWHSPTLTPGLSPFAATPADVARLYATVEAYVEGLSRMTRVTMATVGEAAAALG